MVAMIFAQEKLVQQVSLTSGLETAGKILLASTIV